MSSLPGMLQTRGCQVFRYSRECPRLGITKCCLTQVTAHGPPVCSSGNRELPRAVCD